MHKSEMLMFRYMFAINDHKTFIKKFNISDNHFISETGKKLFTDIQHKKDFVVDIELMTETYGDIITDINKLPVVSDKQLIKLVSLIKNRASLYVLGVDDYNVDAESYIETLKTNIKTARSILSQSGTSAQKKLVMSPMDYYNEDYFSQDIRSLTGQKIGTKKLLSHFIRFIPSTIVTVTGIPNEGKSLFMNVVISELIREGTKFAVFSAEGGDKNEMLTEICNILYGVDAVTKNSDYRDLYTMLGNHLHIIEPGRYYNNHEDMIDIMKHCVRDYGIDAFVIDPYNKLTKKMLRGENLNDYTGRVLTDFTMTVNDLNITLFIVAHPTKQDRRYDTIKDNILEAKLKPNLSAISDSQNWYNMSDFGIVISRHGKDEQSIMEIDVQKVKNQKRWGHVGNLYWKFNDDMIVTEYTKSDAQPLLNAIYPKKENTIKKSKHGINKNIVTAEDIL